MLSEEVGKEIAALVCRADVFRFACQLCSLMWGASLILFFLWLLVACAFSHSSRVVLAATSRSVGDWGTVGLGPRVVLAATSRSVGGTKCRDVGLGSGGGWCSRVLNGRLVVVSFDSSVPSRAQ